MSDIQPQPPTQVKGLRKLMYVSLGCLFVGLAALGVILPGVPTTPFLLLASFFFVRSSPHFHAMLLRSRIFGPFLRDWNEKRAVRPSVKYTTLAVIPATIATSAYFAQFSWPILLVVIALGLVGVTVVVCLPVIRPDPIPIQEEVGEEMATTG